MKTLNYQLTNSSFIRAVFLVFMGTVGSGIFVLPYLFYRSNYVFSVIFLICLGAITLALNLFYSYIVASTKGDHQLAGYSQIYLGKRFGQLAGLNLILLSFGAMAAYYKLFISFTHLLWPFSTPLVPSVLYLLILSIVFLYFIKPTGIINLIVPIFMLTIPLTLFLISFLYPFPVSSLYNSPPNFSFFGAVVYSLSGFTIIPEVQEILLKGRQSHSLTKAVVLGMILIIVTYILFTYGVVVISGGMVSVDGITGLSKSVPLLAKIIALFGAIVVLRASFSFLIIIDELFFRDFHFSKTLANITTLTFPLLASLLHTVSLVSLISITGSVTIFISAVLICLIRLRFPRSFWTDFFMILIIVCLSLGLVFSFI